MPDHLHLVVGAGQTGRLRRVLNGFTCRFGVRMDVLEPDRANSAAIAGRKMRYGFFNPVRAGLVDDPWRWTFSTLRDLGGAAYPLWTQTLVELGAPSGRGLAERIGCSTATVRRHRSQRHPAVGAVLRCLADPRLHTPTPPTVLERGVWRFASRV